MKLSRFLVSVNLAAVIPIVTQVAGHAADRAVSDKTQWLKDNLASMGEASVKLKAQTASLAKSASVPKSSDLSNGLTTSKQLCKLSPFVPNRKLPTKKELEQSLAAQSPTLGGEPIHQLSGKISTFYNSNNPDYTNKAVFAPKQSASAGLDYSRAATFVKSLPSLATAYSAKVEPPAQPHSIPPVTTNNAPAVEANEQQSSIPPQLGFPLMRQAERHLTGLPETTEQANADQAIIDHYAQLEFGGGDQQGSGSETFANDTASSAGPPPFPLNLLPQASLKQLVRGMARPTRPNVAGAQPYFGSWRSGRMAGRSMVPTNLPQAGFHSYIRSYGSGFGMARASRFGMSRQLVARPYFYAPRTVAQSAPIRHHLPNTTIAYHPSHRQKSFLSREMLAMQRQAQPPAVRVAVYPPYYGQVRLY